MILPLVELWYVGNYHVCSKKILRFQKFTTFGFKAYRPTVFVLNPTMRKLLLDFINIFTAHSIYYDFKIHKK